jgi:hypothetical protein
MRKVLALVWLVSMCCFAFAGSGAAGTRAFTDSKGWLHILSGDGQDYLIKPEKWQAGGGFESIEIAPDGKTVGWLAVQMLTPLEGSTNYSYPVALELDIWRDGRVIQKFSASALVIQDWIFLKGGSEVAFHAAPPHGQEFYDCTLFDVNTGKTLDHWKLDRKDYVVPSWAKELLADDPLPGPGEISKWFPDDPAATKKAEQPAPK